MPASQRPALHDHGIVPAAWARFVRVPARGTDAPAICNHFDPLELVQQRLPALRWHLYPASISAFNVAPSFVRDVIFILPIDPHHHSAY